MRGEAGGNEELRASVRKDRLRFGNIYKFAGRPRTSLNDYAEPGEMVQGIDPSGWGWPSKLYFAFRFVYALVTGRIGPFLAHIGSSRRLGGNF